MKPGQGLAEAEITGFTSDSRRVEPGFLFAALPGRRSDGRAYIAEALRRGAAAILAPTGTGLPALARSGGPVALVEDNNPRRRLALMAARFYGRQPETVAAVTGTNGKTSVVWFLRQLWTNLGLRGASLGTLGLIAPRERRPGNLTTPDPVELQCILADLADNGIERLAMEASSHGLDQFRLDGVRITAAAFTNLTRDHLDYHGSMDRYLEAKARLFSDLVVDGGAAVINADVTEGRHMETVARSRGLRVFTYGALGDALRVERSEPVADGQILVVEAGAVRRSLKLPLVGGFQASNALCAAGLAVATGSETEAVLDALEILDAVPGRMEQVAHLDNGAAVYVDYAHTPDALATALRALRPHVRRRLSVVFGCGGDRDPGKRPEMGRVAGDLADVVVIADDNPRSEDPAAIRRQILAACPDAREIGDRAEAIAVAVGELEEGDILVVAGKGHETGQLIGDRIVPFDDAAVVRAAAVERGQ